jgi:pimeloyl-ACP methyl ester carboxylesterase
METLPLIQETQKIGIDTRIIITNNPHPPPPDSTCLKITKLVIFLILSPLILLLLTIPINIIILLCITCILPIYHRIRTNNEKKAFKFPPNFKRIDVGGYKLALAYSDNLKDDKPDMSKPAILFLPGVGVSPTTVYDHYADYFKDYRFIVYDKGFNGNSDDVPVNHKNYTRDAVGIARELHDLVHHDLFPVKNEKLLFIAGSQGGLMAQYYYFVHPEDLAGIVYMDPSTEEFFSAAPGIIGLGLKLAEYVYVVAYCMARLGILRLYRDFMISKNSEMNIVCLKNRNSMFEEFFSARNMWAMKLDFKYFSPACDQVKAIRSKSRKMDIPIACITGLNWSNAGAPEYTPIWKRVQTENIVNSANDAIHCILPNDNHGHVCMGHNDMVHSLCDEITAKINKTN